MRIFSKGLAAIIPETEGVRASERKVWVRREYGGRKRMQMRGRHGRDGADARNAKA